MLIEGTTGEKVPFAALEEETAFSPGKESWSFGAMLALANRGLRVHSVEDFDPRLFVDDPRRAIAKQVEGDAELLERVFEVSDVAAQVEIVAQCLEHPRIRFETRVPTLDELASALRGGADLLVNVNARALNGEDGYAGHLVVIHDIDGDVVIVEDPGPPAKQGCTIGLARLELAWGRPNPGLANFVAITREA
jgi:hypothetical protein